MIQGTPTRTPEGCTLRRQEEAAPVSVNHREVDTALLRVGDVVRVGICCMVLVNASDVQIAGYDAGSLEALATPIWDAERIDYELCWWLQGHADVIDTELCWRGDTPAMDEGARETFDVRQKPVASGTMLEAFIPSGALQS